jgi:ribA/ribD-fused uncharacterized protein
MKKTNPKVTKTAAVAAVVTRRPVPAKSKNAPTNDAQDGAIRFYLDPLQIEFEGRLYPTSEHAYQAGKASKPAVREWILNAPSPSLAAMAAHGLYVWDVVPNWSQIKFDRMRAVLRAKFDQHADLKELLLSTGSTRLVEAGTVSNAVNRLWGEVDGKGENTLGIMLMELRLEYVKPKAKHANAARRTAGEKKTAASKRSLVTA